MSKETLEWLNENTLIGFTEKRGNAWHYRQGNDNHYVGGVPVSDVRSRLFNWHVEEKPMLLGETIEEYADFDPAVDIAFAGEDVPGFKAWAHSETGEVLGVHKASRALHEYDEWLLDLAADVLDDDLQIGSAGLLGGGRMAWVQVEVPDTVETPEGVTFRPFVLFRSAHDGSFATTASRSVTNTVCDNTMAIASGEHGGQKIVFRASGNSDVKLGEARDALGIVYTAADDFAKQVADLTSIKFTDTAFKHLMELEFPVDVPLLKDGREKAHYERVQERRTYVHDLYRFDARSAPWTGTAFGAWQTMNTYDQHERRIRDGNRPGGRVERNQLQLVRGQQDRADAKVLEKILELAS